MIKKYLIESSHDIYEDDYEEGEGANVNWYTQDSIIQAKDVKSAIKEYFEKTLYIDDFSFDNTTTDEDQEVLFYSYLVDVENTHITKEHILYFWRLGKLRLYSNNVTLRVAEIVSVDLYKEFNNGKEINKL